MLRLDAAGGAAAIAIAVIAYAVTQYADFPVRWLEQFNVDVNGNMEYGEQSGFRFDKNVVKVAAGNELSSVRIVNSNGDIFVRGGDVEQLELYTSVWVDSSDEAEAGVIADQSSVHVTTGEELLIEGNGKIFGANRNRLPKMNLELIIPYRVMKPELSTGSENALRLEIENGNGSIKVQEATVRNGLEIWSDSGRIQLFSINGPVAVEGIHVNIEANSITGESSLVTRNGSIFISNAEAEVKANTLNGNIVVESPVVGGNWDLDSSVGEIKLLVPNDGSFSVYGSVTFGHISTDLPLDQTRKTLRGTIGEGAFRIHINATNSISIHGRSR